MHMGKLDMIVGMFDMHMDKSDIVRVGIRFPGGANWGLEL